MANQILLDVLGNKIRLTDERRNHILQHAELTGHFDWLAETLAGPEKIIQSTQDENAHLYYAYKRQSAVGDKWLCVVVKFSAEDAFVVTAYLTDKIKTGVALWPKP